MTELDKKLLEIAQKEPEKFIKMIGEEKWHDLKVCLLRQENYSYGQIQNKFGMTIDAVRWACKQCEG